ncbi:putative urea ABC transporter substrate-binding protein [Methyloligella sp. 2.7D]|uniref:putative urea ABC transporter substrate-binding protein n=1 Tax=unclassified Methyloligella TaxID=2625955 RepID=UPI00157DA944|nr:putative urea ABC transporter substrate-binding protein [Methyloligella sp. GL2]QKP76910.1 ABC transporter substrate-binding protein [Methyloligella sp. GL2]
MHFGKIAKLFGGAVLGAALLLGTLAPNTAQAEEKKDFKLAWSIYAGWMPWGYATENGIVKKWADKYGITIEVTQFNDYIESINQFTAGAYDAVLLTNMDLLAIPAVGGVDTSVLIMGDYSNGNDTIILKGKDKLEDIKGQNVNLVELSVSHYLLARALETIDLSEKDVTVVNTSDADMISAWKTPDITALATWNPMSSEILKDKDAHNVFDSSQIPGEIMDMCAVNTETLKDNPDFGKALVGAWYETMKLMSSDTPEGKAARESMAKASGTDLPGYEAQLATTKMFYDPADAVEFTESDNAHEIMDNVRGFLFDHGLLGEGAPSADVVGIEFPDGSVLGDEGNVKFRFNTDYMKMAADGKL